MFRRSYGGYSFRHFGNVEGRICISKLRRWTVYLSTGPEDCTEVGSTPRHVLRILRYLRISQMQQSGNRKENAAAV